LASINTEINIHKLNLKGSSPCFPHQLDLSQNIGKTISSVCLNISNNEIPASK